MNVDRSKKYARCDWLDGTNSEYGVIPTSWISATNTIQYPLGKKISLKQAQACIHPKPDWPEYHLTHVRLCSGKSFALDEVILIIQTWTQAK